MRLKWLYSLRTKFLLYGVSSAALTVALLLIGRQLANYLIGYPPFIPLLRWIINHIGSVPAMTVTGLAVFLALFFMFSMSTIRYLEEIDGALRDIGEGRLDYEIAVRTSDELGQIARSVNRMTGELTAYLAKITSGLEEIAEGRFDRAIPVESGELAKVADSINRMAAQLDRSIQEERNAEKSKNDLITGVSHDLRTPLTSILGFLEVIEQDRYQDEVELRHYVNIAYGKAISLKKLIEDLFEYTRINNGQPLRLAELDLVGFLRQLAEEFVPSLEQAGMSCRVAAPDEPVPILADGDLLVRSFENLISNAIQYGREGRYVDVAIGREEDQAVVRVINYGAPIPQRDLPFIFDRFYRVERSRSKETGGTGLGLAISKSIVEVHGGRITARSDREQTAFEARFPLALSS
ncbi:sensor histidine kinase [Cohnella nanjingensis]|uniref:histidine kinase n=1 Tax=Cohnella nanjingensis TaxID=1387779 RepID=A0A7X0RP88_9BACL|nr:HAMP domain-containing sensor histidine kinase [Cohnella nanjingensis]MBB6671001.1 HAMP domain-containing histidine kinase [Cohnella nanjingensis]